MAITIDKAYIETFEDNVRFLAQQKPSRLPLMVQLITGSVSGLLTLQKKQLHVQQRLKTILRGVVAYHKLKHLITVILLSKKILCKCLLIHFQA